MHNYEMNRRQALITAGLGALTLGMPGAVIGKDKEDASGNGPKIEAASNSRRS